jgi:hypothetical protein
MKLNIPYYCIDPGANVASLEARLLLPIKTLAYGVTPTGHQSYFQMNNYQCYEACREFDKAMLKAFRPEFLRFPTSDDLRSIVRLHKEVHGVDGMFGSLDCTKTHWKKCPVAWQGSYVGREGSPTIILETVADHHLFCWHFSYGWAGSMSDLNVLNASPLLEKFIDGTFAELEKDSGVVPFSIGDEDFDTLFVLVDGIYPRFSRFVRGMKIPITEKEKLFTKWQEAVRKDVERLYGVLKGKWQFLAHPISFMMFIAPS